MAEDLPKMVVKDNLIKLAEHHKKFCDRKCGISLLVIAEFAARHGIEFSKDELEAFV